MPTYLEGVAVQFYRGIGPETQYIAPFSEMNFFVGPNNAGKSIVLNLIKDRLPTFEKDRRGQSLWGGNDKLSNVEAYRGAETGNFRTLLGISKAVLSEQVLKELHTRLTSFVQRGGKLVDRRLDQLDAELVSMVSDIARMESVWFGVDEPKPTIVSNDHPGFEDASKHRREAQWIVIRRVFGWANNTAITDHVSRLLDAAAAHLKIKYPERMLIPAKRQLGAGQDTFDDLSGKGLIKHLAEIQNPDHHERERKEMFNQITEFVRVVTGKPKA